MALSRRSSNRMQNAIWPGFVDAMTGLLLVLMFVLTIFMVIQFVLREQITGQESELEQLGAEMASLTSTLGLAQARNTELTSDLDEANAEAQRQANLIASLTTQRDETAAALADAEGQITNFEAQVAGLLAQRSEAQQTIAGLEDEQTQLLSEQEALNLALAQARTEINEGEEAARLAAARREALQAMIANLESAGEADDTRISELEAQRLTDSAAALALRERLENADAELTAMTLNLEAQRKEAEETLTLLAAAEAAKDRLTTELENTQGSQAEQLTQAQRQAALLATANAALADEKELSAESQRQTTLLNQQVRELRQQVGNLQSLLNLAEEEDAAAQVQIETLGSQLNTALARVASEERQRRQLEEAERQRLEEETARLHEEAQNLERFKSDFFGQMRELLEGQDRVQVVGDRFIFSSEVLFEPGRAELSDQGRTEIANIADILGRIADDIPPNIDWIIRVDGHTDNLPLSGTGRYRDNWELSQARALSVVRFMSNQLGIPANRLAANGFGEFQPINPADTPEARAQNRRIELKLTER